MKIVQLKAENVKRLKAVEINPDGSLIQITGRNAQGKSSVLDSIAMVLGGKEWQGAQPLRQGSEKGRITCSLDSGIVVTRTLTPGGGGTLSITNADGAKYPSPQAMLDKIVGKLSFDPLAFSRMDAKQQAATLKSLVGLDFTSLDADRADCFARRTEINRSIKALETQIATTPNHLDAPKEEVSIAKLMEDLSDAEKIARLRDQQEREAVRCDNEAKACLTRIESLKAELAKCEVKAQEWIDARESYRKSLSALAVVDVAPIRQAIANADGINRKVRENIARAKLEERLADTVKQANAFTAAIEEIDAEKRQALASAKFPVAGLSFDESGVSFNGVPFAQASSAEQLRVSVAMGLAMNPQLKVLLIRDGSLLDETNLRTIAELAAAQDAQVWMERVDESGTVGVVIEDGEVKTANPTDAIEQGTMAV